MALFGERSVDLTLESSGTVYSSSNPSVAQVSVDGTILGRSGGTAVITATNSGVTASASVTVSAFTPVPIAAYNTPGDARDVDVKGSLIFVADGPSGLQIYTNTSPAVVGKLSFPGFDAVDVRVRDDSIAAVGLSSGPSSGRVAIVNVADPAHPVRLGLTPLIGAVRDVWISGNRVYAASSLGLHVYDISNLAAAPAPVGSVTGIDATSVSADCARGIAVVGTSSSQLRVIQTMAGRSWPQATVALPGYPHDVVLQGTSAYVVTGTAGVQRVDVTRPEFPAIVRTSTMMINALGVAVRRSQQGLLVAAADNIFVNAVPLFNAELANIFNVDFSAFPGAVRSDADGTGIALGDGYGVTSVGYDGIQIFRTQQVTDNAGEPPRISISTPINEEELLPGVLKSITVTARDDVGIREIEFFADDVSLGIATAEPFTVDMLPRPCATQTLRARATDMDGNFSDSLDVPVRALCDEGQSCRSHGDCANGVCASGVCQAPPCSAVHASCADLKSACPTAPSGAYPIDPGGGEPQPSFMAYCDMSRAGGGWTLVAKLTNQDAKRWVNAKASWTDATFYGDTETMSAGQDAKSRGWSTIAATELMLTDNPDPASDQYIATTSSCLDGRTPGQFFTEALAGYPTSSGQVSYKQCSTENTYVPGWVVTPNVIDDETSSPNISLNSGYLSIGRSDATDSFAVISFYTIDPLVVGPVYDPVFDSTGEFEADVGLAASQRNRLPFSTTGEAQDIGGPLSCSVNDALCRTDYPQTVFFFVR
ncbi:fibrinogen-like YCDxxxxGGGW domain-containing protein [Sorangium sp. So ce216]